MTRAAQQISAAEFKATCLKLMDDVQNQRTHIVITKRGKPIAKLIPYEEGVPAVFGYMAGTASIKGDIISPLDVAWSSEEAAEND